MGTGDSTFSAWRGLARMLLGGMLCVLLGGCFQTFSAGGMPQASFDVDADIASLARQFDTATDIDTFYKAPSPLARDRFVTGRLALVDLRYIQFIRGLAADKQQLDAASDLASMTLNLAGTLVGSARAKTNLAAAAAGLGGTKTTVEKNFYYERSVDALVATMNAKRKEALVHILENLGTDLQTYPMTKAVAEVHEYFLAGTLNGALTFITSQAGEQEKKSDKDLEIVRDSALLAPDIRQLKGKLTDSLGAADMTLAAANKALETLGMAKDKLPADLIDSKRQLQGFVRRARSDDDVRKVKQAFDAAGIFKP